ncbi:hypothetical protein [Methylobacter sp.]|uniref:hypothetical protein n=2 Tax=Methylobacter sp. TaxID=2051955 RepID=UPI002FE3A79F
MRDYSGLPNGDTFKCKKVAISLERYKHPVNIEYNKWRLKNMLIRNLHFFIFSFSLMVLANSFQFANAGANDPNRYALPNNKVDIPICEKEALLLHPGTINQLREYRQNGVFVLQIEITPHSGPDVSVLCDSKTGKIIQTENKQ